MKVFTFLVFHPIWPFLNVSMPCFILLVAVCSFHVVVHIATLVECLGQQLCVYVLSFEFWKYLGAKNKKVAYTLKKCPCGFCCTEFKDFCNSQIQLYCCTQPLCPPTSLHLLLAQWQYTKTAVGLHALCTYMCV